MPHNFRVNEIRRFVCLIACIGVMASCSAGLIDTTSGTSADVPTPQAGGDTETSHFLSATTSARKVKRLLTGSILSADEQAQVAQDANSLSDLVTQWMKTSAYQTIMTDFFTSAFQQSGYNPSDIYDQYFSLTTVVFDSRVLQNLTESFGRTATQIVNEARPFTDTMTTKQFMMTPPLMMLIAYADERTLDDYHHLSDLIVSGNSNVTLTTSASAIPFSQSLDPNNPNYLVFSVPQVKAGASWS